MGVSSDTRGVYRNLLIACIRSCNKTRNRSASMRSGSCEVITLQRVIARSKPGLQGPLVSVPPCVAPRGLLL